MTARKGEAHYHDYERCHRYMNFAGQWSFTTREKTIEGPYPSREAAESGLQQYISGRQAPPLNSLSSPAIPTLFEAT